MAADEETRWTDASIRWKDHVEVDGEDAPPDPFRDPDPTDSFLFEFQVPTRNDDDEEATIRIELDGYKADSDQIWNSTGLTLWRAAEHLCNYLIQHSNDLGADVSTSRILELGAGLGLCGITAHRLQALFQSRGEAGSVILTDGDTDALAQLRSNVHRNQRSISMVSVVQLLWGRETSESFLESHANGQQFDVLLASDVVYVSDIVVPLWETVQTLLEPTGVFLFAYCSRRHVPVTIDYVLSEADKAGFAYEQVEDSDGILIYKFRWKG